MVDWQPRGAVRQNMQSIRLLRNGRGWLVGISCPQVALFPQFNSGVCNFFAGIVKGRWDCMSISMLPLLLRRVGVACVFFA